MKKFLMLVFVFCAADLSAQFSFPAEDAIKVNQSNGNGQPKIGVQTDGSCWILWNTASQWLKPDLSFDGNNYADGSGGNLPIAVPGGAWAKVTNRDTLTWEEHHTQEFTWSQFENRQYTTKSVILFTTESIETLGGNGNSGEIVFLLPGAASNERAWFCYNILGLAGLGGVVWNSRGLVVYNFSTGNAITPIKKGGSGEQDWYRGTESGSRFDSIAIYGIPTCIASRPADNRFIVVSRTQHVKNGVPYLSDPKYYFRTARLFSVSGDSLIKEIFLDSLSAQETDLSDKVVLGSKNDFFIVRHAASGDTLLQEHFNFDGTLLDRSHIASGVLTNSIYSSALSTVDYDILNLPDGRFVLAWTKMRGSASDVFACLLDENMTPLGNVKRINSDTATLASDVNLANNGDMIYATWKQGADIYFRRFRADQITSNEIVRPPSAFGILDAGPNPCRGAVTLRVSFAENCDLYPATIDIFDVLGKKVSPSVAVPRHQGMQIFHLNVSNLRNGAYNVVLTSDGMQSRKSIVVLN